MKKLNQFFCIACLIFSTQIASSSIASAQLDESSGMENEIGYEETIREEQVIPFQVVRQENPNLPEGQERIVQKGQNGIRSIISTYIVKGGIRELKDQFISDSNPVNQIVEFGTQKPIIETTENTFETTVQTEDTSTAESTKVSTEEQETKSPEKDKETTKESGSSSVQINIIDKYKKLFKKNTDEKIKELPKTSENNNSAFILGISSLILGSYLFFTSKKHI